MIVITKKNTQRRPCYIYTAQTTEPIIAGKAPDPGQPADGRTGQKKFDLANPDTHNTTTNTGKNALWWVVSVTLDFPVSLTWLKRTLHWVLGLPDGEAQPGFLLTGPLAYGRQGWRSRRALWPSPLVNYLMPGK
ncbi:hypothetical protein PspLS_06114 [Pyricularia sp. CBS 133598]|nr:hypothetical protein PspLS_06114 [Pyricularia sp. CBS 133598]